MLERLVQLLEGHSFHAGVGFVFTVLLLCGFGLPMPEDVVLVTGGYIARADSPLEDVTVAAMLQDRGLLWMVATGLAGILAGDSVIFWAGRKFGARVAEVRALRRIVTPEKLEKVETLLRQRGNIVVVFARFLPGLRAPTYFTVGHARLPYWEFVLFDGAAALVSAPVWVCLGFYFGHDIENAARKAGEFSHYVLAAVLVVGAALLARWWRKRKAAAPPA